jgi:hypothetical protein
MDAQGRWVGVTGLLKTLATPPLLNLAAAASTDSDLLSNFCVCMHFSTFVVMYCSNNLWTAPMRMMTKAIEKCTYVIQGHCKQGCWEFFRLKWLQAEVTVLLLETVASGSDSSFAWNNSKQKW